MTSTQSFNMFQFKKTDFNSSVSFELHADDCETVVNEFASFMRGCGFADSSIYSAMSAISEEYFMAIEKTANNQL